MEFVASHEDVRGWEGVRRILQTIAIALFMFALTLFVVGLSFAFVMWAL